MNTPNKLTLLRIILVPVFCFFLLADWIPHNFLYAGIVFGLASITDYFDGMLARKHNLITDFGKFMDPVADKLLVTSAITCFIERGLCSSWILIVILAREFLVTSIRLVAASKGNVIAANMWGKVKTVSQIAAIVIVIIFQWVIQLLGATGSSEAAVSAANTAGSIVGAASLWICAALTLISGAVYIIQNREIVMNMK